jgi:hypothetical protein
VTIPPLQGIDYQTSKNQSSALRESSLVKKLDKLELVSPLAGILTSMASGGQRVDEGNRNSFGLTPLINDMAAFNIGSQGRNFKDDFHVALSRTPKTLA